MAVSFMFAPIMSAVFLAGAAGLPISVPPLEEDPALARVAPQECLWYMSAAGMAEPDPNSTNKTEQLFAEPELQALFTEVESQLIQLAKREAGGREERVLATELPKLIKIAITHPLAGYVADVQVGERGPDVRAGIVVKVGDRADEVEDSLKRIMTLAPPELQREGVQDAQGVTWYDIPAPPDVPQLRWGIREGYFILGIGEGESNHIVERLGSQSGPPAWLTQAKNQLPIERRSTIGYINVAGILDRARPHMGRDAQMLDTLGISNIQAIYSSSGLDEVAAVTKGLVALNGAPTGALELLPQKPLSKNDLQLIPKDATVAVAVRVDAKETLEKLISLVSKFEPRAREEFEEGLWEVEAEVGIDIRQDLLGNIDDTAVVYMPGGPIFTAWTGSAGLVKVKDQDRLQKTIDKLVEQAKRELEPRDGRRSGARFKESKFGDYTLHYMQIVGEPVPFTPSWCITEDFAVVGLTPNAVKNAIRQQQEGGESLADQEDVATVLSEGQGPSVLSYLDAESLVRGVYPMMMFGLQAASGELAREGFDFDMALIPSVEAIAAHMVPAIGTWSYSPEGFRFMNRQTLPGGDFVSSTPVLIALTLPAVQSARFSARTTQEMNSLKQLSLAALNHEDTFRQLPSNIYDKEGKALLSWRVKVLPFLEGNALYEQFRLDEPWDSEHNKRLLNMMPQVYASPTSGPQQPGYTRFQAVAHKRSLLPGTDGVKIGQVVDGTSNTLLFVQAAEHAAVPWTKPADITWNDTNPKQPFMSSHGQFLAAFCDGSVRRISNGISNQTLKNLVFRDDGNRIDHDEVDRPSARAVESVAPRGTKERIEERIDESDRP